jgi:ATP-binding cassette, subfamily B, bacterial
MTSIAVESTSPEDPLPGSGFRFVARTFHLLRPYWFRCSIASFTTVAQVAFNLSLPICYKLIFDRAIGQRDSGFLWLLLAGIGVGFLMVTLIELLQGYLFSSLGARVTNDIRMRMFRHLQRLPVGFYGRVQTGDLMSRFTNDLNAIDQVVTRTFHQLVFHGLSIVAGTAILLFLEWHLALVTLLALPLGAIGPKILGRRAVQASNVRKREEGGVISLLQENILAQKVIRAFGLQQDFIERFGHGLQRLHVSSVHSNRLSILMGQIANTGILLVQLLVIGAGAYLALKDYLSPGDLVAFLGLLSRLGTSARTATSFTPELIQAAAGKWHIDQLLAESPEEGAPGNAQSLPRFSQEIRFSDVSFSYTGAEVNLDKVSFTIPAGESVAFVGRSGSGKSTVLNLLSCFYSSAAGTITIDGHDIKRVSQDSLSSQIGTVFQDSFLFNTSVGENIRRGCLGATDQEVEEAAKAAEIHDFITRLPRGYDTPVGEMGGLLSGGQRQRLALARAILRNPSILVLDEATSALDPATEAAVNATLDRLSEKCTLISVTHRLSSAANMDRIFVMDDGKLIEQGTHKELLNQKGVYYQMWQDFTLELTQNAIVGDVDSIDEEVDLPATGEIDQLAQRVQELEGALRFHQQEGQRLQVVNQRWAKMAGTDRLTGLPNKVAFLQALMPQEILQAQRHDSRIGLILLGGDDLGRINETYGRDAGDQVLRGLSESLRSILKGEEVLGHIDGTHFSVVFHPADLEKVQQRAEELRLWVEQNPFPCADTTANITISVGITSMHSTPEDDPRQLAEKTFEQLNSAIYAAKRAGGNRVEILDQ